MSSKLRASIFPEPVLKVKFAFIFVMFTLFSFSVTGYLIANLAVADLSVGILCIPFTVLYFEFTYWPFGYALCKIIPTTQAISVMASIGTLAAISLGKYCMVT